MNDWVEYAGMVVDLILMLRILALKLRSTYMFITLFALLNVFYDGLALAIGIRSAEIDNISSLSRLVFAIVFPLVAWDVFEEAKSTVEPVRKPAMLRMMQALVFVLLWGLVMAAMTGGDDGNQSRFLDTLALVVWAGSIASALAFFWTMRRSIKIKGWELPRNTTIWYRYFLLLMSIEGVGCLVLVGLGMAREGSPKAIETGFEGSNLVLQLCVTALTAWCVLKLRAVSTDVPNVSVDVSG